MDDETMWNVLMRMARVPWDGGWDYEWTERQMNNRWMRPLDLWWPEAIG